jgi:hypothetical protein
LEWWWGSFKRRGSRGRRRSRNEKWDDGYAGCGRRRGRVRGEERESKRKRDTVEEWSRGKEETGREERRLVFNVALG